MAEIVFHGVSKAFGNAKIIENLDLTIENGKFTVLVGASGCGKTTLLRMIAGIGPATSGTITLNGEDITDVPPGKRGIAMVFQNYAIYPTMSVKENIEFGLKNNRVPKVERERLVREVSEIVDLKDYLTRKPSTLSGGQRQRVALARAMVKNPKVFLMDEPLSNLDAKLRVAMRTELIELHKKLNATFIYVTHDQVEAMAMADVIILMDKGKIQQVASPETIYNDPNNVFTAQFIGTPPMNILPLGKEQIQIGFRPEKVCLSRETCGGFYERRGTIVTREMLGSETLYKIDFSNETIMVKSLDSGFRSGEVLTVSVKEEDLYFFDAAGMRIREADDCKRFVSTNGGRWNER